MSAVTDLSPGGSRATTPLPGRLFYWSLRRELWENRSLYVAPVAVGALVLIGYLLSTIGMPARRRALLALDPAAQAATIAQPYEMAAFAVFTTMFVVAAAYCLGALHGERRDRSILFWKSLPVSDLTTVATKAAVPILVMPAISFATILAVQFAMALASTAVVAAADPEVLVHQFTPLTAAAGVAYGLFAMSLWWAPLYGWLLLVSGWARRVPLLWAVLPPLGLALLERIAFGSARLARFIGERLMGGASAAFVLPPQGSGLPHQATSVPVRIDLGGFLASPGLWVGLALASGLLVATVWLRRRQEPI